MSHFLDDGTTHIQPNLGKSLPHCYKVTEENREEAGNPHPFSLLSHFFPQHGWSWWIYHVKSFHSKTTKNMGLGHDVRFCLDDTHKDCVSHYLHEPLITSATLTKSPLCPLITWYVRCTTKVMTTSHAKTKLRVRIRHYFYYKIQINMWIDSISVQIWYLHLMHHTQKPSRGIKKEKKKKMGLATILSQLQG